MSDEGEKTCPLCAEEMDLTDLQLKACKCGYEICVWCWHNLMDMAEKDDIEGRCPACRVPYDKEKIVGMAANCESRLITEINSGRKTKLQKSKTKPSEGRKQLSSVRVIQRNLVYIVGLPLDLADEDLLQHREYFGQYGKVLKVSMSRTASGVIQQFPNDTCSVYITYSKEEEAVRCIQLVHGFTLEGRPLRACFGTTKYCHAWLRNMPCSNSDCMYLHEIGSQEDSFTKDEIISAYTRNRVQQIMGHTSNLQRRSGNVLPPPAEDYYVNNSVSAGKPIVKNPPNNMISAFRGSPPNGSSCTSSLALPAAASWGTRSSYCQTPASSLASSNDPSKHKPDTVNCTLAFSSAVTSTNQASQSHINLGNKSLEKKESNTLHAKVKPDLMKSLRPHIGNDSRGTDSEKYTSLNSASPMKSLSSQLSCPVLRENNGGISMSEGIQFSGGNMQPFVSSLHEKEGQISSDGRVQNLISDMSSLNIDGHARDEHTVVSGRNYSYLDNNGLEHSNAKQLRESLNSPVAGQRASVIDKLPDYSSASKTSIVHTFSEVEEDILSFDNQRLKDPEVVNHLNYMPNSANPVHVSNHARSHSLQHNDTVGAGNLIADHSFVDKKINDDSIFRQSGTSMVSNGYDENLSFRSTGLGKGLDSSLLAPHQDKGKHMQRSHIATNSDSITAMDARESNIVSDILSMDFDAWNGSLASSNLSKLLGVTDKQPNSVRTSSWKMQNNNQSRFSFARQESLFSVNEQFPKHHSFENSSSESRDTNLDEFGFNYGNSARSFEEFDCSTGSHASISSNKHSVSRAQISTPPGFSIPSRVPPPGFGSPEIMEHAFDTSGNHSYDTSSLLRNTFQALPTGNIGSSSDIEFMDPAILAVGRGRFQGGLDNFPPGLDMRHNFPPQMSTSETDARLQLLMHRSISQHQNARFSEFGDRFTSLGDSYATSSRLIDQSRVNGHSHFGPLSIPQSRNGLISNGHWDGWNEVQGGNSLAMAELLKNERLGLNKYYNGYEDAKFSVASSGDQYNRSFGM